MSNNLDITSDDALLIVDVQNDFCPGGALAVEEGDRIIPVINEWIRDFADHGLLVFSSRDGSVAKTVCGLIDASVNIQIDS